MSEHIEWFTMSEHSESNGAGGENRTLIACLEGRNISRYTTPADILSWRLKSIAQRR